MSKMTPQTLREDADRLPPQDAAIAWVYREVASAWEADLRDQDILKAHHDLHHKDDDLSRARIEALKELVSAERDLPLKVEPNYEDPKYTEKHGRAALARKTANMPLPLPWAAPAAEEKK